MTDRGVYSFLRYVASEPQTTDLPFLADHWLSLLMPLFFLAWAAQQQ